MSEGGWGAGSHLSAEGGVGGPGRRSKRGYWYHRFWRGVLAGVLAGVFRYMFARRQRGGARRVGVGTGSRGGGARVSPLCRKGGGRRDAVGRYNGEYDEGRTTEVYLRRVGGTYSNSYVLNLGWPALLTKEGGQAVWSVTIFLGMQGVQYPVTRLAGVVRVSACVVVRSPCYSSTVC